MAASGELTRPGVCRHQRVMSFGTADDAREGIGRLIAQIGDVYNIDREGIVAKILHLEQRVSTAKREYRRVAIMRGDEDGSAGWSTGISNCPSGRYALLGKPR